MSVPHVSDDRFGQVLTLLEQLVAFDTDSAKSNLALIEHVRAYLAARDVPCLIIPNAAGDKASLFATIGPMVDGGVVLSGHTDVVPVTGQSWTSDPFRLRHDGSRLYGRGACDMKGFDAIALAMVDTFKAAPLQRPIHLLFTYDEETTCLGPVDTIARFGRDLPRPRAVIVGEPTLMQVADAHKSISTYFTTVHGHEAHSAKPHLGANAVQIACEIVAELYRIGEGFEAAGDASGRFDPAFSSVHVGTIAGGTARNILAKECRFHWEFRGLPAAPPDAALVQLQAYIERIATPRLRRFAPDAWIETVNEIEVPGLDAAQGSAAETLALKLTRSNRTIAVPFATEGGRFQKAGIATIVCGPGNIDQAHQPDEYIAVEQIDAGLAFLRRLIDEMV